MKKVIIGVLAAVLWIVAVGAYAVAASSGGDNAGHDFTILAVKEKNVNDYNGMPVFKQLAKEFEKETGKDVYWTFNNGLQYTNNPDPLSTKGIDAIYHANFSNLRLYKYGKSGRIVAIDEYLDSMPRFKKILEERPDICEALKSPDGHIYSLPRVEEMGLKAYPNILFLNKVWVEKLIDGTVPGGEMPDSVKNITKEMLDDGLELTRNQFKDILKKFAELDMDGDGRSNNEIPLTFVSRNWQGNESDLIASFGVPENREHKTVKDGKIIFTVEDEKWFEAVRELNAWHKEQLIPTSAFTQKESEFLAFGQDGRYGSFYWWEKNTVVKNPEDYIIVKPLADDDGNRYVGVSNEQEIEKSECVILSSCKDIKGLLSYFDKFFAPEISAQLNYGSIDSGAFETERGENGMLIPNDDHGEQSADDFRTKNAPYGVVYLTDTEWGVTVEMESRAKDRLEWLDKYVKPYTFRGVNSIPNLNYTVEELNELSTYELSLGNNINAWFKNSITDTGSTPTRDSWQNLLNDNRRALDRVKAINQAAYDRYVAATGN